MRKRKSPANPVQGSGPTESCQKLSNSVSADEVDVHVDLDSIVVVSAPVIGAPSRSDISGVGIAQTNGLVTARLAQCWLLIALLNTSVLVIISTGTIEH